MGYTTVYYGSMYFSHLLSKETVDEINAFSEERHENNGKNIFGSYGGYYCDWQANMREISHNGREKSYNQAKYLEYIIKEFIPENIKVNGVIFGISSYNDVFCLTCKDSILKKYELGDVGSLFSLIDDDLSLMSKIEQYEESDLMD